MCKGRAGQRGFSVPSAPSRYPALTTTTFEVTQPEPAASPVGSRQTVTFLPGDPAKMKLVSTVEAQTSAAYFAKYHAAMAAMMLAGCPLRCATPMKGSSDAAR